MNFLAHTAAQGAKIFWTLIKISLPLLIVVKLLDDAFSVVAVVGGALSPVMSWVGLPGEAGIVWAAAMCLQIYSALLLLASLWTQLDLTAAQATILAAMILVAHSLPVELRIAQKAGARPAAMFCVRIAGAVMLGAILHLIYDGGGFLQNPAQLLFAPAAESDWAAWTLRQAQNWLVVYIVIVVLLMFVHLLKITRAEQLIIFLLAPILRALGIGDKAITITLIGVTLGLSYGGGLLIAQAKTLDKREALCVLALLGLCHSLLEDTLIMLLIGAHLSGVLVARLCFTLAFMAVFAKTVRVMSDETFTRFFALPDAPGDRRA